MPHRVVAAGTFDGIHPGHESFLRQARALGDELVVIVARDSTVERLKGHRPAKNEAERQASLEALPVVDQAVLGSVGRDYLATVVALNPAVVALGYDQWPDEAKLATELTERGLGHVTLVRLKAFEPEQYHSSLLSP